MIPLSVVDAHIEVIKKANSVLCETDSRRYAMGILLDLKKEAIPVPQELEQKIQSLIRWYERHSDESYMSYQIIGSLKDLLEPSPK